MAVARTAWARRANHAMTDKQLTPADIAKSTGYTRQHVSSVVYGRVDSPKARKKISDFLGISDSEDDE